MDGIPYAACDRHHQEILLKPEWADGNPHVLALHGWTGLGGFASRANHSRNSTCEHVRDRTDPPADTRFHNSSRIALETVKTWMRIIPAVRVTSALCNEAFIASIRATHWIVTHFYKSVHSAMRLKSGIETSGAPLEAVIHATGTPTLTLPGCGRLVRPVESPSAHSTT